MGIEDQLTQLQEQTAAILRELRELRAERRHQGGRWASRAEAARHHGRSVDWIDARLADGSIRGRKIGPEPAERRDRLGRRVDRRRWEVWIDGGPLTDAQIDAAAREARA